MTDERRGRLWNCTFPEYLGDRDRWSNSLITTFIEDGPRAAWAAYCGELDSPDTPAKRFGRLVHCAILEPHAVAERFVVKDWDGRTKEGKARALECAEQGIEIVSADDMARAETICRSVIEAAHERADDGDSMLRDLLAAPGRIEQACLWTDDVTGLPLRGRFDKLIEQAGIVLDLKTARRWRPAQWAKSAAQYRYHCQAWLYSAAFEACFGRVPRFYFLVVHSEPPHEVMLGELGLQEFELGMIECRWALREIAKRMESGCWHDDNERGVVTVTYPAYVHMEAEMRYGPGELELTQGGKAIGV